MHRAPDARELLLRRIRKLIEQHGWAVTGYDGERCDNPACSGGPHPGLIEPVLYTAGLTAAGLPELVIKGASAHIATHMLNGLAKVSLGTELVPGVAYPAPEPLAGAPVMVEVMSAADTATVCKIANALYGRGRVRALEVVETCGSH